MKKFSLFILCAGYGKRMEDLTTNTPKPLLKIKNTTLLSNTINFFKDIGCDEFFINTHFLYNKIEKYVIKNFNKSMINIIYEPSILGTGGAVKNMFNYTKNKNICVVNSDIFWQNENKKDVMKFVEDLHDICECKLLLSKKNNFYGLKKINGDFIIDNQFVKKWNQGDEIIFDSGMQILSKNVFKNTPTVISMNDVWNSLIIDKKLKGDFIASKILHIGDKKSFQEI